jgi:hypothetical protein
MEPEICVLSFDSIKPVIRDFSVKIMDTLSNIT